MHQTIAETEMSLMAVERVNHYATNLETEAAEVIESNRPSPSWPENGHIVIKDLVVQYKPTLPPVIKGINLEIHAGNMLLLLVELVRERLRLSLHFSDCLNRLTDRS